MKKTKKDALKTRTALLDAAEKMFYERGVASTTLAHIAGEAGMTRGAVYWHFKNKIDILSALIDRVRMPLEEMLYKIINVPDDRCLSEACQELETLTIRTILQLHDDPQIRRVYTILLLRCDYSGDLDRIQQTEQQHKDQILQALTAFFTKMKKQGLGHDDMDPRITALAIYTHITGIYTGYLQYPDHYRMPEDAAKLVRPLFACFVGAH